MSNIRLLEDAELAPATRERVRAVEASGADASVLRAVAHRQDMFARMTNGNPSNSCRMTGSKYASLIFSQVATSWNWVTQSTALL